MGIAKEKGWGDCRKLELRFENADKIMKKNLNIIFRLFDVPRRYKKCPTKTS
jgi:hypothetical protein